MSRKIQKLFKEYFILFLILIFAFIFYQNSRHLSFLSDDFFYLNIKWPDILHGFPDFYHYNPVFWFLIFITKILFGYRPLPFHLLGVAIHLVNIILVYFLSDKILRNRFWAILSAFLFAFFFSHYEVVYWVTGINTSLMGLFSLLGIIALINFTQSRRYIFSLVFSLCFFLAVLSHEYALSLVPVGFCYFWLFSKNRKRLPPIIRLFTVPLLIIIGLVLLKLQMKTPVVVVYPTLGRFFISVMKSFLYHFLPGPFLIDNLPKSMMVILFIILVILLWNITIRNKVRIFLLLWVLIAVILFAASSLPQARYFYVSSLPAILLMVSFIMEKWKKNGVWIIIFFILPNILFLSDQLQYWYASSEISDRVIQNIVAGYPNLIPMDKIVFVDLPDASNNSVWKAYLFRGGLNNALEHYTGFSPQITYFRLNTALPGTRNDPVIPNKELLSSSYSGTLVFIYDQTQKTVEIVR